MFALYAILKFDSLRNTNLKFNFQKKQNIFFFFDELTANCHLNDVSVNFHAIAPHTDSHKTKQKIRKNARK